METEILLAASLSRPFCHIETRIVFNERFLPRAYREIPYKQGSPIISHFDEENNEYWRDMRQMRAVGLILLSGGGILTQ